MNKSLVFVINCSHLISDSTCKKLFESKKKLPLSNQNNLFNSNAAFTLKYRNIDSKVKITEGKELRSYKNLLGFRVDDDDYRHLNNQIKNNEYLFVFCEGVGDVFTLIILFSGREIFEEIDANKARLESYGLPPSGFCLVDTSEIYKEFYRYFSEKDPGLFSINLRKFLNDSHVLIQLFSQLETLDSRQHLSYIEKVRIISDKLREWIKPWIHKIEKNHPETWGHFCGERISFLDGGTSRVVSLPGITPMGIRVGIYTVMPGEKDPDEREKWNMSSYVVGNILNGKELIDDDVYQTDTKRLQEAARYIVEPLTALRFLEENSPRILLIHGPLQNKFETYDEQAPNYIPGISEEFLSNFGLDEERIRREVDSIPNKEGFWRSCIPVYAYIMKRAAQSSVPIAGVVERANSRSMAYSTLDLLEEERKITKHTHKTLKDEINKLEIRDAFLFGCILEEGEYIKLIEVKKQTRRQAHDRWESVVAQMPPVYASMIKTSSNSFPFRVELNSPDKMPPKTCMQLIYHTSLLLPRYAFPVGIDIADKYAKIPDWLSRGISAHLAATIYKKCIQHGDENLLSQIRNLFARSPRDFFYRPKS